MEGFSPIDKKSGNPEEGRLATLKEKILKQEPFVINVCRKILAKSKSADMSEVLANEALYRAVKNVAQFREESNLNTWLTAIAKNTIYDHFRKTKTQTEKTVDIGDTDFRDEKPSVEEAMIDQEQNEIRKKAFQRAFEKLPDIERRALQMTFDGLETQDIGEKLGLSRDAANGVIFRARRRLAKSMGQPENFKVKKSKKSEKI